MRLTSALALGAGVAHGAFVTLLRGPYLQNLSTNRASVLWTTRESGAGSVTVTSAGQSRTFPATGKFFAPSATRLPYGFYQYQADLTGLSPDTAYTYTVSVGAQALAADPNLFQFRTSSSSNRFSFLAFGDSGQDTPQQKTLVDLMQEEKDIAMVIHTGDLSYPQGDYAQYEDSYFGQNSDLMRRLPFFPTPGNHDNVFGLVPFLSIHSTPRSSVPPGDEGHYYSFDWGNVHFASIDSNMLDDPGADRMLAWLDADLQATQKYWRIVFYHHASFPTGHHAGDPICRIAREKVNPIVQKHGVQLVLAGHEHGYERTLPLLDDARAEHGHGVTHVITGGGGATLHDLSTQPETAMAVARYHYTRIDVDGDSLTLRVIGLDGAEFDRVVLHPAPVLTRNGVVSASDFSTAIAAGSLLSIFGQNLALDSVTCTFPLPVQRNGVGVLIAGSFVPLLYLSPTQINCQIPFDLLGDEPIEVITPNGSDTASIVVSSVAPAILNVTYKDQLVSRANPVPVGSVATAYMTGLGKVAGVLGVGQPAESATHTVLTPVDITIGASRTAALYAGLAPGFTGLYQVNFSVPISCKAGENALQISTAGVSSRGFSFTVAA